MRIKERPRDVANMWEITVDNWLEEEETGLAAKVNKDVNLTGDGGQ